MTIFNACQTRQYFVQHVATTARMLHETIFNATAAISSSQSTAMRDKNNGGKRLRWQNFVKINATDIEEFRREWTRRTSRICVDKDLDKEKRGKRSFHDFVQELAVEDNVAYTRYFRIDKQKSQYLLSRIENSITKQNTVARADINTIERLCITLRYLDTGETFSSLETMQFRVSRTAISYIVVEVC